MQIRLWDRNNNNNGYKTGIKCPPLDCATHFSTFFHIFFTFFFTFFSAHCVVLVVRPFKMIKIAGNFCARDEWDVEKGLGRVKRCICWAKGSFSLTNQTKTAATSISWFNSKPFFSWVPTTLKLELKLGIWMLDPAKFDWHPVHSRLVKEKCRSGTKYYGFFLA